MKSHKVVGVTFCLVLGSFFSVAMAQPGTELRTITVPNLSPSGSGIGSAGEGRMAQPHLRHRNAAQIETTNMKHERDERDV